MDHALAVIEPEESAEALLREAGELAAGVDGELTVLHVTSNDEYEKNRERFAKITSSQSGTYSMSTAKEGARQFAENMCLEHLNDLDVAYNALGKVGDKQNQVLDVARTRGCDYIFVSGRKRSPTGKALFGDTTQAIILDFDGSVVVKTD